jgi:two-component sensor histidine kinase
MGEIAPSEYVHALVNILEDFAAENLRLEATQKAVLNIAEDGEVERLRLRDTKNAVLNILEDLAAEKALLERTQGEVVRSEKRARVSLREKEVLLKEVHHRVKNNLQVISSLLNLQARHLEPAAREIFGETQQRVQAIALVHARLCDSADLSRLNFRTYMTSLLDDLFGSYSIPGRRISKEIDVDNSDASLPIDCALPCGLIVNELVTNALKHAFPAGRDGTVRVALRESNDGELELTVADDGVGMSADIDPQNTASLGLELVFTFAQQIDARVEIEREGGTSFRFRFPKVTP